MLSRNNYFEKTLKSPPTVSNSESVIPPKEISNSFPENSTNCLRNSQFHTIFSKNREDCFLTYFIKPSIILSKTVKKENYWIISFGIVDTKPLWCSQRVRALVLHSQGPEFASNENTHSLMHTNTFTHTHTNSTLYQKIDTTWTIKFFSVFYVYKT